MCLIIYVFSIHWIVLHMFGTDIRNLISLDDVTEDEELNFGPNGGLVFCFEYVSQLGHLSCWNTYMWPS